MSARPLELRRQAKPQRPAVAWYLAGGDPSAWLEELSRWRGAQAELRLYPLPQAAGLLVIPPSGSQPPVGWRALALGTFEGRFFLPVDAAISPEVTPAEVRALCRAEITFFHPTLGLMEWEAADRFGVWDLLEAPALQPANWNAARAGLALSSRLLGVALRELPEGGEIFGDANREIGSEPTAKLPPRAREPSAGPISQAGRAVAKWGAEAVQKILSWMPSGSPPSGKQASRTWINDAMDWAAAKLMGVSREMEEMRHRELHRLMDMLASDPERGLRHALPLAGTPGRGRANPGAQLGMRDLRFRRGGGRSGAVDPWDVPWEIRQKLSARYRELALRERQLGRFQRAAYIYAELLGDWSSAAAVLKEGKLFAEAGVVFRDRLHQPRAAAECFAAGGLFAEAILLYEKERLFLELGDLHRRLGNEEAAAKAYWQAADEKTVAGDFVGAAVLIEERLKLPDDALKLLGKAWPGTPQAAQCLTAQFALLGRLGRHEAARQRVAELRDETTAARQILSLAEVLGTLRKTYPDASLRPFAADVARVKISERLDASDANELRAAARILGELAPEDRLLARDTSRFLAARIEAISRRPAPPPPLPPPRKAGTNRVAPPVAISDFKLPKGSKVLAVKRCGQYFVAAIEQIPKTIAILRGNWVGIVQAIGWTNNLPDPGNQVSLVLHEQAGQPNHVLILTAPRLLRRYHVLEATDSFADPLSLGAPSWLPDEVAAVAIGGSQWWVLRGSTGEWIVDIRNEDGHLTGGFPLTNILAEIEEPVDTVCMLAVRSQLWIAFGRSLFLFEVAGRAPRRWQCETPIIGLESSAPFLASAVVARCEQGAAVFWCDHPSEAVEMLASELGAPFAASLGNGTMFLLSSRAGADGFAGRVIDLDQRGIHREAEFSWQGDHPAGLVAMGRQDGFAIFTRFGEVHLFRVPIET